MIIEAKKLMDLPVAAMDTRAKIGEVGEILVAPENGKLLGFLINERGFSLAPRKALAIFDIKTWDPKGLVTESYDNLVDSDEIVRIKEVLDKKIILLGLKARTESGKNLGSIEDFLIDTETEMVVKYYLKDLLGKSRIFPADKVISIETKGLPFGDKAVIFSDDVVEPPTSAQGAVA